MWAILANIIAPILLLVALGAAMRWKFRIDIPTLSKLNIYLFVPAFVFDKVSSSSLPWAKMGGIVAITILHVLVLGLLIWAIGRASRVPRKTLAAVAIAVMFYNSGNYGLPLAKLAFNDPGAEAQAFVLMTQNLMTFTVGLSIAAIAHHGRIGKGLTTLLKLPVLPTLAAALLARLYLDGAPDRQLPRVLSETAGFLAAGLVPVALVTLGAQLAASPRWPRWRPVCLVVLARLLVAPAQMAALLFGFHWLATHLGGPWRIMDLWPWPAQVLILTASVPTAVNTLLLTLELGGDADLAADSVFWTTIFSGLTITLWLLAIRAFFGAG